MQLPGRNLSLRELPGPLTSRSIALTQQLTPIQPPVVMGFVGLRWVKGSTPPS